MDGEGRALVTKPTVTSMTQALQWNKCCGNLHMKKLCMWLTNVLAKYTNTQSIMHKIIFSPSAVTLLLLGNPEGAWGLRVLVPKIDFTISLSFRFLCQKKGGICISPNQTLSYLWPGISWSSQSNFYTPSGCFMHSRNEKYVCYPFVSIW